MQLGSLSLSIENVIVPVDIIIDQRADELSPQVELSSSKCKMTGSKKSHLRLPRTDPSEACMPALVVHLPCLIPRSQCWDASEFQFLFDHIFVSQTSQSEQARSGNSS